MTYNKRLIYLGVILLFATICIGGVQLWESSTHKGQLGQYMSVEEYLVQVAERDNTVSLTVWEIPFVVMADKPVEVAVVDRKLEFLEHHEELDEHESTGTLETWRYNWLVKINPDEIPLSSICLSGGRGVDENGYISQTTCQFVLARRYLDGSYDILGEVPLLDALDYFSHHNDSKDSVYKWYFELNTP